MTCPQKDTPTQNRSVGFGGCPLMDGGRRRPPPTRIGRSQPANSSVYGQPRSVRKSGTAQGAGSTPIFTLLDAAAYYYLGDVYVTAGFSAQVSYFQYSPSLKLGCSGSDRSFHKCVPQRSSQQASKAVTNSLSCMSRCQGTRFFNSVAVALQSKSGPLPCDRSRIM